MNTIELMKAYIPLLDEVYQQTAKSSVLDVASNAVTQSVIASEVIVPKMEMDGLTDYSRNGGYTSGNVKITYQSMKYDYDRGRKFTIDAMDNVETADIAFGRLSGEFTRTKVVPEIDAVRFAKYATLAGTKVSGALADGKALLNALNAAYSEMTEQEVPEEGRILFVTPTLRTSILALDTTASREILAKFAQVVEVPSSRFASAIELLNTEQGGFTKTGADINFLIVEKSAIVQTFKHVTNHIIAPEMNNDSDGFIAKMRYYGLNDVYENKVAGIYAHTKPSTLRTTK